MNYILESIKYVADNSINVKINQDKIKSFAQHLSTFESLGEWHLPYEPLQLTDEQKVSFAIVFCSTNFCFWGNPKWEINYQGKKIGGAYGIMAAFNRAIEEGNDILNPDFLEKLTEEKLKHILRGNCQIPLLKERLAILCEIGRESKRAGKISFLFEEEGQDALELLDRIVQKFPSFNDVLLYNGKKVYFYKRAQLLIRDIYDMFHGKKYGNLRGIEKLTAFADYKIPWVLRKLGILEYSSKLSSKIASEEHLFYGSSEEVEIRACMVWAVELIRRECGDKFSCAEIDMFLWLEGKKKNPQDPPHHLTLTTAY